SAEGIGMDQVMTYVIGPRKYARKAAYGGSRLNCSSFLGVVLATFIG
ncbi:hypothetical protein A2U01_0069097, partial [Trifolium medium]|nr:hypothetical protein [Trifolium medium]